MERGRFRAGTSGYAYPWTNFYPPDLKKRDYLAFHSRRFDTVELNTTSYHLPRPETYDRWAAETPDEYVFGLKLSRYITHIKRISGVREPLRLFFRGARRLGPKLGPVLVQLPPRFRADARRLASFLVSASKVAEEIARPDLRLAFEFRDESWFTSADVLQVLREHGAALVLAHSSRYPYPAGEPRTADWMYLRFHGPRELFASRYGPAALRPWAERIRSWIRSGEDVYAYFNNDSGGHAPIDARTLRRLVESASP
jgi:uncharacterized protein YecE (DUF72 family)